MCWRRSATATRLVSEQDSGCLTGRYTPLSLISGPDVSARLLEAPHAQPTATLGNLTTQFVFSRVLDRGGRGAGDCCAVEARLGRIAGCFVGGLSTGSAAEWVADRHCGQLIVNGTVAGR